MKKNEIKRIENTVMYSVKLELTEGQVLALKHALSYYGNAGSPVARDVDFMIERILPVNLKNR